MIQKNPGLRYQDCQQIIDDLGTVEKNTEYNTILKLSTINHQAKKNTTLQFQITHVSEPTIIKSIRRSGLWLFSTSLILTFLIVTAYLNFAYNESNSTHGNSLIKLDVVENVGTNQIASDSKVITKMSSNNETAISSLSDEVQGSATNEIAKINQNLNSNKELLEVEKCMEVGTVGELIQQQSKWSIKKIQHPPEQLLKQIRKVLVHQLAKDNQLMSRFDLIAFECSAEMESYKISILVSDYKKDSKIKKIISKVGLGKEKITLILTIIDLNTNIRIANKEIELKDLSDQLNSNNKTEWLNLIKPFLYHSLL
jgi:hypothetical protein